MQKLANALKSDMVKDFIMEKYEISAVVPAF